MGRCPNFQNGGKSIFRRPDNLLSFLNKVLVRSRLGQKFAQVFSTRGPSVPYGKETRTIFLRGQPSLQRGKFRVWLWERREFTQTFAAHPLGICHLCTSFWKSFQKSFVSPWIWQTWKLGCLGWRGPKRGSNLFKFIQLLMAELGWEPSELIHHLGFCPFMPHLHCLACTFHLLLCIFCLPTKTAFISHSLSIYWKAGIMLAALWL